jgi:hypothetical protein
VPYEDGVASAAEVRKRAANKEFKQVFLLSKIAEAHGRKREETRSLIVLSHHRGND